MKAFDYERPATADAAVAVGQKNGTRYIAGGTLLVDLLRLDVEQPDLLVDINELGWSKIESLDGALRIGALVSNTDLAYHPRVQADFPVLSQALLAGASPQIRNLASVGGNLLQRTRCSYFRDVGVQACNKRRPGSGCAAIDGYSRQHAILGGSANCIAVHPSDLCVALLALDAHLDLQGPQGMRQIALADLHTLPGDRPEVEHTLLPGELVTHVRLERVPSARHSAYVKVRDRASFAFALASAAVVLQLDGRRIRQSRVALGGVGTKPWRSPEAEATLDGQAATPELFVKAALTALAGARPTAQNAFKIEIAQGALVQALGRALEAA